MPGLFGYWTETEKTGLSELLATMGSSMRHHPGLIVETNVYPAFCAGRVHLGYFQHGTQPIKDTTGRCLLWLDGEFNNELELVRAYDLEQTVAQDQGRIALALYQKVGWRFLRDVDGLFNIVLYEHDRHRLTLANDRYGLRPLYWIKTHQGFAFAGEVKALLPLPEMQVKIDSLAVDEWFSFGYLLGNRTWIDGIELYPSATIMQVSRESVDRECYWSWDDIQPLSGNVSEEDIVEELGRLWIQAVESRVDNKKLGQGLSGGLDSRAILAALPQTQHPYHTFTFGLKDCDDVRIARQVAAKKGVAHHFVDTNANNWLFQRAKSVWLMDGLGRFLDYHGMQAVNVLQKLNCEVLLNGYLGDATIGGSYLDMSDSFGQYVKNKMYVGGPLAKEFPEAVKIAYEAYLKENNSHFDRFIVDQRGRRFIHVHPMIHPIFFENRLPFFDNSFIDFVYSLNNDQRFNSRIYNAMLLMFFPEYYVGVPWQKTGLSINASLPRRKIKRIQNIVDRAIGWTGKKMGISLHTKRRVFTNYPEWLRSEPARSFSLGMLGDDDAHHTAYIDQSKTKNLVREFFKSGDNRLAIQVGLLLSFEIYLRQLFELGQLEDPFQI